jgi:hypothetical protein
MFASLLWVSRFTRSSGNWQILFDIHNKYRYLVTCLHLENKSEHLFRHSVFFTFIMSSFSSRHKLHRLYPGLYALTFFIMDHFIVYWLFSDFSFQTYLDSSVLFLYSSCQKDLVWLRYLVLKSPAVMPMYIFFSGWLLAVLVIYIYIYMTYIKN